MFKGSLIGHIIISSLVLFIFKWFFSYYFFEDDISVKVIFDTPSDGFFYYVYSNAITSLDFNYSYDLYERNLNNLPIPFYGILLHSILLVIFQDYSILILEFVFIFLFVLIFSKIFRKLKFIPLFGILFSILYFSIPSIIDLFNLNNIRYINSLSEISGLRFPRPLIVNIFFYYYLYYLLKINFDNFFNHKNFFLLAFLFSITLSSFYYYFIIQIISLTILLLINFSVKEIFNINKLKYYLTFFASFIFFSIPFIYFILTSEKDYLERMYVFDLNLENKIQLINHLFIKLFSLKVIVIISLSILMNIYINKDKFSEYRKINIFFIVLISSIIAPFLFIILTNKTGLIYHFSNLIVVNIFLYFYISISFILNKFFILKKIRSEFAYIFILFILFIYNFNNYLIFKSKINDKEYTLYREGIYNSTKVLKMNNNLDIKLVTFEPRLMVWSIMNDIKYIKPLSGQLVPKKHELIENDLIEIFRFLNFEQNEFINFFKNEFSSWRLFNKNTQLYFWGRYSVNRLRTFNKENKYTEDEKRFIKNTSPTISQSIAIPLDEFDRLRDKYDNLEIDSSFYPDLIVLNQKEKIFRNLLIKDFILCDKISNSEISIYISIRNNNRCKIS